MSICKPKGREEYIYDFWYKGHRFHGPAGPRKTRSSEDRGRAKAEAKAKIFSRNDSTQLALDIRSTIFGRNGAKCMPGEQFGVRSFFGGRDHQTRKNFRIVGVA